VNGLDDVDADLSELIADGLVAVTGAYPDLRYCLTPEGERTLDHADERDERNAPAPVVPLRINYAPSPRYWLTDLGQEVLDQNEAHIAEAQAPANAGQIRHEARELAKNRHAASQDARVIDFPGRGA
jgi:hypothetical protein